MPADPVVSVIMEMFFGKMEKIQRDIIGITFEILKKRQDLKEK